MLSVLGIRLDHASELYDEWDELSLGAAEDDSRVTRGLHIGFPGSSREKVDEFWRVGVDAGYVSDGEPGPRPEYGEDYYGGFLLDPDGTSAEAVHYSEGLRADGTVDHLWIRVRDVAESKRFYELVAPFGRFEQHHDSPERAGFSAGTASFSVLAGAPTTNLHLAFPADDNATVDEFHRTLVEAGYQDNGAPGYRPIYHAGYYGAFVLDPDGTNVEVVCHNR